MFTYLKECEEGREREYDLSFAMDGNVNLREEWNMLECPPAFWFLNSFRSLVLHIHLLP